MILNTLEAIWSVPKKYRIRYPALLVITKLPLHRFCLQAVMTSKLEGESKVLELQTQGEGLREHLEESRKPEVQQLVEDTEQQWRALQQAARQAELRSLSDDFDTQSKNTQCWIRDRQQQLQAVGSHTPPDHRCHAAQVWLNLFHCSRDMFSEYWYIGFNKTWVLIESS